MMARDRQTVADLALMASGSEEAMFAISRINGIPLDDSSASIAGTELQNPSIIDKKVTEYYERNHIVPANEPNE